MAQAGIGIGFELMQQSMDGLVPGFLDALFQGDEPAVNPKTQAMGTGRVRGRFGESSEERQCGKGNGTAEMGEVILGRFTGFGCEFGGVRLADLGCDLLEQSERRRWMEKFDGAQWWERRWSGSGQVPGRGALGRGEEQRFDVEDGAVIEGAESESRVKKCDGPGTQRQEFLVGNRRMERSLERQVEASCDATAGDGIRHLGRGTVRARNHKNSGRGKAMGLVGRDIEDTAVLGRGSYFEA